jgi:hypothetical protein
MSWGGKRSTAGTPMSPLDLVELPALMERSQGRSAIAVVLIDGPVVLSHPDLADATIREIPEKLKGTCTRSNAVACAHATFVAGILSARRGSVARQFVLDAPCCCAPFLQKRPIAADSCRVRLLTNLQKDFALLGPLKSENSKTRRS